MTLKYSRFPLLISLKTSKFSWEKDLIWCYPSAVSFMGTLNSQFCRTTPSIETKGLQHGTPGKCFPFILSINFVSDFDLDIATDFECFGWYILFESFNFIELNLWRIFMGLLRIILMWSCSLLISQIWSPLLSSEGSDELYVSTYISYTWGVWSFEWSLFSS